MSKINDILAGLGDLAEKYTNVPPIELDTYSFVRNIVPEVPKFEIDEKSTFAYQMQQQTNQIIEKSNEQIALLVKQNEQLSNNYQKLEDLYKIKEQELSEAKTDAKKAKRYNTVMLILTIISMLTAIAAWLLPNVLGGAS